MKNVIFTHGGGRFANQFLTELNLAALQMEYGEQVQCLSLPFQAYDFFQSRKKKNRPTWKKVVRRMQKMIDKLPRRYGLQRGVNRLFYNGLHYIAARSSRCRSLACGVMCDDAIAADRTDEVNLLNLLNQNAHKNLVICGWPLRCWGLVGKHAEALRARFVFAEIYGRLARQSIDHIHAQGFDKIIGIQIRHTDYREFLQGKYFFDAQIYLRFAEQAAEQFYPDQKTALLVTSDAPQPDLSSSLPVFAGPGAPLGTNHYITDFAALSLCDMVIAPPSTFAASACFLGDIPYLPLTQKDQVARSQDILLNNLLDAIKNEATCSIIN